MSFRRELGPFDATMVVIGGIIGVGIFNNPSKVALVLDTPPLVLAAWAVGGLIAIAGAFAYAELGNLMPRVGGQYAYLNAAWHPLIGFLYGWALLFIIETGAIAGVAIIFGEYLLKLVGATAVSPRPIAVGAIVLLSLINYFGVKPGSRVLNVFVMLKIAALGALVVFAWFHDAMPGWFSAARVDQTPSTVFSFGQALVPILFAYGGWQVANYVAEEMRDPERHLPRSLILGTLTVVVIYLLVNVAYLRALGLVPLASTETAAADAAAQWFGDAGGRVLAAVIATSAFGFLNLAVLAPTRVYYAMAADGAFFPALSRLHPRYGTPSAAIFLQSAWAIALTLTGGYDELVNSVVFADWIFFGLTVAGLFVLRPRLSRQGGYRTPGYPWIPGGFVIAAAFVVYSSISAEPVRSAVGAGLLLLGVPVFYIFKYLSGRRGTPNAGTRDLE